MKADVRALKKRLREPDIAPYVLDAVSPEEWLADPHNVLISDSRNMMMFEGEDDGVFRGHWLLRDRGKQAFIVAGDLVRIFFESTGARLLYGWIPVENRASRWFTRQMGFQSRGVHATEQGLQEWFGITRKEFERRYGFSARGQ